MRILCLAFFIVVSCRPSSNENPSPNKNAPPTKDEATSVQPELYKNSSSKSALLDSLQIKPGLLVSKLECSERIFPLSDSSKKIGDLGNPFNLVVSALEFANYSLGGLGAIVNSSIPKIKEFSERASIETNLFLIGPHYMNGRKWNQKTRKICTVEHVFNSYTVQTEILLSEHTFSAGSSVKTIPVFLVKSDARLPEIFNIENQSNPYGTLPKSDLINRIAYFSSAVAAFMQGLNADGQRVHVLHNHSLGPGLAAALLEPLSFPARPVSIMHMHNLNRDQGIYPHFVCGPFDPCNLMAFTMKKSDFVITVSKTMVRDGLNTDPAFSFHLSPIFNSLYKTDHRENRVEGISNGVDFSAWDPFDPKVLSIKTPEGDRNFSFDPNDISGSKFKIKQYLVSKGYIADAKKPLFVFVGRYSPEKGVDMLEKAIKTVVENEGSFIVMGARSPRNPGRFPVDIQRLRYREHPDVHIMHGNPQLEQFGEEKPGLLIRAAADFALIPSHEEAFGLVPIEFFSMGTLAITSSVGGMQDYIQEYHFGNRTGNSFNYFEYEELGADGREPAGELMEEALVRALRYYRLVSPEGRSQISKRLISESKQFDWLAVGGAAEKQFNVYREILRRAGDILK